jgi:hypothetical protein
MAVKLQEMHNVTSFQFWNLIEKANKNNCLYIAAKYLECESYTVLVSCCYICLHISWNLQNLPAPSDFKVFTVTAIKLGQTVEQLAEALRCKPVGREFDSLMV